MDIKIEGLNGQLPNLDLFNLASKMCSKEGLYHTFKNRGIQYHRDATKEWWNYFKNLLAMMATQATGVSNFKGYKTGIYIITSYPQINSCY